MNDRDRYQAGKTIRTTQFGVRLPDGTVEWFGDSTHYDFDVPAARERYLEMRADQLRGLGLHDPGVQFLKRVETRKFSTPVEVGRSWPLDDVSTP